MQYRYIRPLDGTRSSGMELLAAIAESFPTLGGVQNEADWMLTTRYWFGKKGRAYKRENKDARL